MRKILKNIAFLMLLLVVHVSFGSTVDSNESAKIRQTLFYGSGNLATFLQELPPSEFFPHADSYGQILENPTRAEIFKEDKVIGYVVLNSDFVNTNGYSGKPIHIVIGLDLEFNIVAAKLVKHSEPIVLIGIPIEKVNGYIDEYLGRNYSDGDLNKPAPDVISGATVTVMVINETIARTALLAAKRLNTTSTAEVVEVPEFIYKVNREDDTVKTWQELLDAQAVSHLHLKVGEVNDLFLKSSHPEAAAKSESNNPEDVFIDMYFAPISQPSLGKSLLGVPLYNQIKERIPEGQEALVVASNGLYSFKGSGYVRGGLFDRLKIKQDGESFHFRDLNHTRIGDIRAKGAPRFKEVGIFIVPDGSKLDLTQAWQAELLIHRAIGATDKGFLNVERDYKLPESFIIKEKNPDYVPPKVETNATTATHDDVLEQEHVNLQEKIAREAWKQKTVQIVVLAIALFVLFAVFMLQEIITSYPVFYKRFRIAYLCFTLFWIGGYLGAQLSVVNVLTFTNSFLHSFDWTYFLMDPIIFILWCATAFGSLMWNRGTFCGWLCPFGALQELTNNIAKKLGVKQLKMPFKVHERLTAIKYVIFLVLFGVSLYDLGVAEHLAEVEPFKTSIILKFNRAFPYVAFAVSLVVIGLFIERFYCRYLCPMGAALAIPAKLRLFNWLKRYQECGNPCQKCAQDCPVEAIFSEGQINENECIQCLNCQVLYHDHTRCMHLLIEDAKKQKALDRQKRIEDIKAGKYTNADKVSI